MGSLIAVIAAAASGLVLAAVGSFTVIQLAQTTPTTAITAPVVAYGDR